MQLESLKIFCDVVRHHSFSRGASANAVSQSAASQVVHQIEKRLGVPLIDRSRRPWTLTEEGKLYYERCQELVDRYEELEASIRERRQVPAYNVRVAAIYSVGFQDLGEYIDRFRKAVPNSDVNLEFVHPTRVYEAVLNDEADLGIISFPNTGRELTAIAWRQEPMMLACLPGHPLASKDVVSPTDLNGQQFIAFERGLTIRREIDRFLRKFGVEIDVVMEFDNIETIKKAIEDGFGLAILPEPTLRREVERHALTAKKLDGDPLERPLCIIHRRRRPLNAAVTRFIELLTQVTPIAPTNNHTPAPAAHS